jgi:hypothetical protein
MIKFDKLHSVEMCTIHYKIYQILSFLCSIEYKVYRIEILYVCSIHYLVPYFGIF